MHAAKSLVRREKFRFRTAPLEVTHARLWFSEGKMKVWFGVLKAFVPMGLKRMKTKMTSPTIRAPRRFLFSKCSGRK